MNTGLNINGITVISKEEIVLTKQKRKGLLPALFLLTSFGFLFFLMCLIAEGISSKTAALCGFIGSIVLCVGWLFLFTFLEDSRFFLECIHTGRYEYTVNIHDEVPFTKLAERYHIHKNHDGTYTLIEREALEYLE